MGRPTLSKIKVGQDKKSLKSTDIAYVIQ